MSLAVVSVILETLANSFSLLCKRGNKGSERCGKLAQVHPANCDWEQKQKPTLLLLLPALAAAGCLPVPLPVPLPSAVALACFLLLAMICTVAVLSIIRATSGVLL